MITVGVLGLVLVAAAGAAAVVAVRTARRRYRSVRARLGSVRVPALSSPDLRGYARASGTAALDTLGSPGWWLLQHRRHRMWRSVSAAQHAVRVARRADVAVGDLPLLAGRLGSAAAGVDAVMRAGGRSGGLRTEDRLEYERILTAAADLHAAALSSLRADARVETDTAVSAVQIEVAALAAGIRAAHR
ncbi:MAG: hypothetical protein JOZ82_09945 [Marmoricola sp.]|nr:hypothetical protein [Marmoricola sp.]